MHPGFLEIRTRVLTLRDYSNIKLFSQGAHTSVEKPLCASY